MIEKVLQNLSKVLLKKDVRDLLKKCCKCFLFILLKENVINNFDVVKKDVTK